MSRKDILLAGVGGQGTVLASKILARCAIARGEAAHTAETIGMAQRGGCVTSHVRIGECSAPLIARGCADAIIAFEPAEAVRALPYLKKDGAVIVNTAAVKPVTDTLASTGYEGEKMVEYSRENLEWLFRGIAERGSASISAGRPWRRAGRTRLEKYSFAIALI